MTNILFPLFPMVLLNFIVGAKLFADRRSAIRKNGLRLSNFAEAQKIREVVTDSRASDHFKNLFEMPVLFYVLCLALLIEHSVTNTLVVMAWFFVILRYAQAYIHCTNNRVSNRILVFLLGTLVLLAMWIIFAAHILAAA